MNIVIHQFKREIQAQRFGILLLCSFSLIYLIAVGTGFFGEFHRTETLPLYIGIFEILSIGLAVLPIILAAALAIEDPPSDLEAHWCSLPVQRIHLLAAKLAALMIGVILPFYASRVVALLLSHQGQWINDVTWSLLSNTPAWVMIAFGLGALFGSWKHFTWSMISLLASLSLLTIAAESLGDYVRPARVQLYLRVLDNALEDFLFTNLLLPSGIVIIALCYFTRLGRVTIPVMGFIMVPITAIALPFFTQSLTRTVPFATAPRTDTIKTEIQLPDHLVSITNRAPQRTARLPYSSLTFTGFDSPQFLQPQLLQSTLQPQSREGEPAFQTTSSRFNFPDPNFSWATGLGKFEYMERHLMLPRAVANYHIINPPFRHGDGFDLFEIAEDHLKRHPNRHYRLNTHIGVQLGTYEEVAIMPLEIGHSVVSDGIQMRLAELLPQVAGRTQVMINEQYVSSLKRTASSPISAPTLQHTPDPESIRYVLVNASRNEACLPVKHTPFREHRLPSLGMRSSIIDFSIPNGPTKNKAIATEWLEGASLHVFRRVIQGHATLQFQANIDIGALPVRPSANPSFLNH